MSSLVEITIESLGGLGDGIATHNNKPLFVAKSCVGDRLRVSITKETVQDARGEIMEIISPGPTRATPPCPHFSACGGCSLMHFSSEAYQTFKRRTIEGALRQAGFVDTPFEMTFLPAATRRRVELKFNGTHFCYYQSRSHTLVPIEQCLILEPALQALLAPLSKALSKIPDIKTVSLTAADSGVDVLLSVAVMPANAGIQLLKEIKNISRISIQTGDQIKTLFEISPITMRLGKYDIALPPDAFLQAAREGQKLLTDFVLKYIPPDANVADLFCGIGTYSFPLSERGSVHAVESEATMVNTLQKHAPSNLTREKRDLFKHPLTTFELKRFGAAVINPPRMGAKSQCEQLAHSPVSTIVMISCNPATWARDAKTLKNGGFALTHLAALDQFVYSPHTEIASVFKRI